MTTSPLDRVIASEGALALLASLRQKHGALMFFQSGGCCDGSAPMCFAAGEFHVGPYDVYLGNLDGTPFYMGHSEFEYFRHAQVIIDVVDGTGDNFSLENGSGQCFLTRSRLFSDEENALLEKTVLTPPPC